MSGITEAFCSILPVAPVVANAFPVTVPLYFDTAPTCPDIYDTTFGRWETLNQITSCIDCYGPPESGVDATLTVFFPGIQEEVCYYQTCTSSMYDLPDIETICCTSVSATFPPCENVNIRCEFETLTPGVPLTDAGQAQKLKDECFMKVFPQGPLSLNIFNSSNFNKNDADLGSPNRACSGGGPGRGKGGKPWIKVDGQTVENPYKNCDALGNLLIVQNENIAITQPNDNPNGGCMYFTFFDRSVTFNGIGLLDIEEGASISIQSTDFIIPPEDFPDKTGNNGYLDYRGSVPGPGAGISIDAMEICFYGSGAISYIDYNVCKPLE